MLMQLSLCGQEPETALKSALASVKFYVQQKELDQSLLHSKLEGKIARVQEACKRKLQVVTPYLASLRVHLHDSRVAFILGRKLNIGVISWLSRWLDTRPGRDRLFSSVTQVTAMQRDSISSIQLVDHSNESARSGCKGCII